MRADDAHHRDRRQRMVKRLWDAGIRDQRVLDAMAEVPRHLFVDSHLRAEAYSEHALPIGCSQTISHPYVVARMSELLQIDAGSSVLEIGTGSGYHTAVLAKLARWVFSLERISELARVAIQRMRELKIDNVKIQAFDGTVGWSEMAPFDRIVVAAGAPRAPDPLIQQLGPRGRLLIPEGDLEGQRLVVYERLGQRVRRIEGEAVAFVPLIGRYGWKEA